MITALKMSEAELQKAIIELAKRLGWRVHHTTSASVRPGAYVTPLQGHRGFPDLVLLRPPRVVFAELKVKKNRLSQDQAVWLNGLQHSTGVAGYEWREADWFTGAIEAVLA